MRFKKLCQKFPEVALAPQFDDQSYDANYEKYNLEEQQKKLEEIKEKVEELSKRVNVNAGQVKDKLFEKIQVLSEQKEELVTNK